MARAKKQNNPQAGNDNPQIESQLTPEDAMNELTELSQELGLYDNVENPLIKDNRDSVEASQEPLQTFAELSDTLASPPPTEGLESLPIESEGVSDATVITISGVDLTKVMKDVVYAGYLGGVLDKTTFPRIQSVPFSVRIVLPNSKVELFNDKSNIKTFETDLEVIDAQVAVPDVMTFLNYCLNLGKRGYIHKENTIVQRNPCYIMKFVGRSPMQNVPFVQTSPNRPKFTRDEMRNMAWEDLKYLGQQWYGTYHRNREQLIRQIDNAQNEK